VLVSFARTIGASVRVSAFVLFVVALLVPACRAEARWCDVLGHGDGDKILYPPIARAARVSGTVLARIVYTAQGDVTDVTSISGSPMLATSVREQLKSWHLKTNASGNDLCESLAIIDFRVVTDDKPAGPPPQPTSGSIMRLSIEIQPLILSDPAAEITKRRRRRLFQQ
jgi:hypothetical protein